MKVLFLMFAFPDLDKSFNMYTALVEEFHSNGHLVYIVAPANTNEKTTIAKEKQLQILRVKTLPVKNVSKYLKGISNLFLPFQYSKAIRKYYPGISFDMILIPTPPITLVELATLLKKKYNSKLYLMLRDIFPQNAVDLGFMKKNGIIYRFFRKKEKKLYNIADYIGCMSQGNIDYILKHNPTIEASKVHELKNFQKLYINDNSEVKWQEIKSKSGLEGKCVVVFGGNMGKPQQLENVLELAKQCMVYPDVLFLLLGEGTAIQKLEKKIEELNISNITVLKTIPKRDYQDLISVCDIGLISLHENFTIPNIPSKTLDYFNVGLPVLASIDKSTDYGKILEQANAGLWSYAGDHKRLKQNFDMLYHDLSLRTTMGKNGRKYFEANLTPDIAYHTIIKQLGSFARYVSVL